MANCAIDDDRKALDDLDLSAIRPRLSNFERHHVADYPRLASNHEQIFVVSALYHDIAQDPQDAFRGRSDIEPWIASATGHLGLKSASSVA